MCRSQDSIRKIGYSIIQCHEFVLDVDVLAAREDGTVIGAVRKISYSAVLCNAFVLDADVQVSREDNAILSLEKSVTVWSDAMCLC